MDEIDTNAKIIWDYMLMHHALKKADAILVFGSHDTRVAERGAELFLAGWAPLLVFSGGSGEKTKDWERSEAEVFADIAIQKGVPADKILKETASTNSQENVLFTKKLLEEKGLNLNRFIIVHKPYMERRTYATFKNFLPEPEIILASLAASFEEYVVGSVSKEAIINNIVGDLQRIKEYPAKGFQIPQEIPDEFGRRIKNLSRSALRNMLYQEARRYENQKS